MNIKILKHSKQLVVLVLLVASNYAAAQAQRTLDSVARAARRQTLDSLITAKRQQEQEKANIRKAVQVALDKEAATHAESQIGAVSLNANNKHSVYESVDPEKIRVEEHFKLREMNFHLENGRLLRVYATGEIWRRDSIRKQRLPDPTVVAASRRAVRLEEAAKAAYDRQNNLLGAARAIRQQAPGSTVAAAQRDLDARQRATNAAKVAWLLANAEAQSRSADTVAVDVPATTPPSPRIVTTNEWHRVETVRFTNTDTSIDLNQPATGKSVDFLHCDNYDKPGPIRYVRFLDLVSIVHTSGRHMLTDNANWTLKPDGDTTHRLTAGSGGLANLVEVALYTDLLSTLNNEDNGLVSTEVASWLPINSRPLWRNGDLFVGTAVRPYLAVSRLDSKFDTLRVNTSNAIDRPNLVQRAYLRFGLNLNLLTWDNRGHVTVQLNTSWMRSISRVTGNSGADTTVLRNAYQNLYGLEVLATVRRQRNFGADLYFTAYLHNVQSRRTIENPDAQWALRPGALFYYYPFGSPSNKLFFRVSNFIFPQGRQRDFVQLQIGYSIGLNSLVNNSDTNGAAVPASVSGAHLPGF
jgi:hypothetical protein